MAMSLFNMVYTALSIFMLTCLVDSYKILVYSPTISRSHMIQNARVADTLAKGGHDVTVLELEMTETPGSLNQVKYATLWKETHDWPERPPKGEKKDNPIDFNTLSMLTGARHFLEPFGSSCLALLRSPQIMNKIRDAKFDLIMFEQFDYCPFFIAHLLDIKVKVWMSSCPIMEHQASLSGVPPAYSYVPIDHTEHGDQMTFLERFRNMIFTWGFGYIFNNYWDEFHKKLVKEYRPDIPNPFDLAHSVDLTLINTDELVDFPRPLPPNVIHVGGLGMPDINTTLPSPYDSWMQRGEKGVIYFSFGTLVSTKNVGDEYMRNILDSFSGFKDYFFIVKISKDDLFSEEYARDIGNVKTVHWAPQPGILAHPHLKFFITHGGYNGIMEASRFSVPLLSIGIFGDQLRNAKLVERNGWGIAFDKNLLRHGNTEFKEKIQEMLTDPKYKKAALRTTKLLRTKPQTGEQRLLSYIRFLEENDGHLPELRTIANQLTVIQYYNLDAWALIVLIGIVLVVALAGLLVLLLKVVKRVLRKEKTE